MRLAIGCMWLNIITITLIDIWWFLAFARHCNEWECNPIALYVVKHFGVQIAIGLRFLTVVVGLGLMSFLPKRCCLRWTIFVWFVHMCLFMVYANELVYHHDSIMVNGEWISEQVVQGWAKNGRI